MLIRVTEDDIRLGERHDSQNCPVARALTRTLGRRYRVDTTSCCCERGTMGMEFSHRRLAPAVRKFIRDFDNRKSVCPFEFSFPDAPEPGWKE